MTDEEINTTIAEVCGWTEIGKLDPLRGISPQWKGVTAYDAGKIDPPIWDIPDYYNDLNAMHEAEKTTFKNNALLWHRYASFLDRDYCNQPYTIGSTAWQRAEAFLKTLNLWKQ